MLIDPEQLLQAFDETEWHASEVQGFKYGNRHVIRDCTRKLNSQEIWSRNFDDSTYDASHEAMMCRIRLEKFRIACERYQQLDNPNQ